MHQPKYGLFYDNHTLPACPDVGQNFDVEAFTDRLRRCNVDFLTFHARCNEGMAYYETQVGIKHPSLTYDLFGKLAQACQQKGIALNAYLNGGISSEEGLRHREWTTLSFDGREYREPRFTPFVRTMCYNSGYRDHLITMVREIAARYPVSGFFIDCLLPYPCVCPTCVQEMKRNGINWDEQDDVVKFSEFSAIKLSRDIARAAREIKPDLLLYFNGVGFEEQADAGNYLECECLPTAFWGYEYLPVMSRYLRTLGRKTIMNMTGRFYDWSDFGGLRPEEGIKFDVFYGLANGLRPNIGSHFHPRGDLEAAVLDQNERIYRAAQAFDAWFHDAQNVTEIAVVYPCHFRRLRNASPVRGAVRMLEELKYQFDVVTHASDWTKYKVLVIPDDVTFDPETARRVEEHLDANKPVISSGASGLDPDAAKFVLEKDWGVQFEREDNFVPAYFEVDAPYNRGLPAMPMSAYCTGTVIKPLVNTRVAACQVSPYFDQQWDGEHAYFYNPPDKRTDHPALTISRQVAHFSHRIFTGYADQAPVQLRQLFANVLAEFLPVAALQTENLPSFVRVFVSTQPGRTMAHILAYVPELRGGKTQIIEDAIEVSNVVLALKSERAPREVYLAPERSPLPYVYSDAHIRTTVPSCRGYTMVVFET